RRHARPAGPARGTGAPGRADHGRRRGRRTEEVELSWKILDPIEEYWDAHGKPAQYPAGTWGPVEADDMLERDGRSWRRP
ncbi:hypothetical protein ABZ476_33695, partial [Streptomyces albogriseolus]